MARIARVVAPGLPHHVAQRGNQRESVFFEATTIVSIGDWSPRQLGAAAPQSGPIAGCPITSACQSCPLGVTRADADGLRATFAEAYRRYTGAVNARFQWTAICSRVALGRW